VLEEIPGDTPAHDEAQPAIEDLRKEVAATLQKEAASTLEASDGDLEGARNKLERAIELAPEGTDLYERIETTLGEVNRKLDR